MTSVDHAVGRKFTGMFTDTESAAGTSCVRFHCRIVNASAAIARSFTVAPSGRRATAVAISSLSMVSGANTKRGPSGEPPSGATRVVRFRSMAGFARPRARIRTSNRSREPATPLRLRASSIGGPPTSSGSPA
ncbi:Uncharacterised protein [Mycobacterium tuberculosis]|uniref:Uncharacterized protein n=1 Tax=Mycobacterium tuberculosis TaxID=1773 RepID=A0A655J6J9_MYCTX|nr:Uncharacterised protein [Mycobacterium tuberculosis]COX54772.1 Uncharacterised protein [Mycobacterium tuberculosis]COY02895.1 Uncharacterised protein [Mycobacterium tuberculosis]